MIFDILDSIISAAHVYVSLFVLMWENNICYVFKQVISEVCQRCAITVNAITVLCRPKEMGTLSLLLLWFILRMLSSWKTEWGNVNVLSLELPVVDETCVCVYIDARDVGKCKWNRHHGNHSPPTPPPPILPAACVRASRWCVHVLLLLLLCVPSVSTYTGAEGQVA